MPFYKLCVAILEPGANDMLSMWYCFCTFAVCRALIWTVIPLL